MTTSDDVSTFCLNGAKLCFRCTKLRVFCKTHFALDVVNPRFALIGKFHSHRWGLLITNFRFLTTLTNSLGT